jgi:D-psicose/D-tagatose/L-ribulose 3-epimerase
MRLGVNCWVWGAPIDTDHVESFAPRAADLGADLLEIPVEDPAALDSDRVASVLDDAGLGATVAAVVTDERDLLVDDPAVRATGRQYVRDCVDVAAAVGADRVGGPLYAAVGRTWTTSASERERLTERLAGQLSDLADYAHDRGVTLCLEPLNRFETSFVNTVEQGVAVVDRVDHEACGLLLDTFHMNVEEKDVAAAIRRAGSHVKHVHACANDRGAPGNGHLPWDEIADALAGVGYDGPVVVESFTPAVESIARAAAVWRPFEPSQDQLAADGLSFLDEHVRAR